LFPFKHGIRESPDREFLLDLNKDRLKLVVPSAASLLPKNLGVTDPDMVGLPTRTAGEVLVSNAEESWSLKAGDEEYLSSDNAMEEEMLLSNKSTNFCSPNNMWDIGIGVILSLRIGEDHF
jgi:hypothetical protein